MTAEVKVTMVTFEEFSDYQFQPPATFYTMSASQLYYFYHTRDRAKAQETCNEMFGEGRYTVKASKIQKGNGNITCSGTQTRKGQK